MREDDRLTARSHADPQRLQKFLQLTLRGVDNHLVLSVVLRRFSLGHDVRYYVVSTLGNGKHLGQRCCVQVKLVFVCRYKLIAVGAEMVVPPEMRSATEQSSDPANPIS